MGVADDPNLPDTWSPTSNVAWVAAVPGLGWSSPVVWGDHVFVTSVVNTAQQEPPKPGFYLGDWPASTAPHRWLVYDFDPVHGKEFLRFSYAGSAPDMREAVERIGGWLNKG